MPYLTTLVQAGSELAAGQGLQQLRIDHDNGGLVKGADQVLAERVVDADLAADRAVHLREQRRRHVGEGDAAKEGGGREPGGVADDAAAHGHDRAAAVGPGADQRLVDARDRLKVLEALTVGQEDRFDTPRAPRCSRAPCRRQTTGLETTNRRAPTPCASSSSGSRSLMPLPIQIVEGREPAVTSTRTAASDIEPWALCIGLDRIALWASWPTSS